MYLHQNSFMIEKGAPDAQTTDQDFIIDDRCSL